MKLVNSAWARTTLAVLLAIPLGSSSAQSPALQAPAPQPGVPSTTIKVSTRLVTVDVVVKDKKGQPVPGLTQDDFQLFEDDQPQAIRVFSVEGGAAPAAHPPAPLPPGVFSNQPNLQSNASPSAMVILLDGLNTSPADLAMARTEVGKFLQKLPPQDFVALYSMGNGLRVVQDFTNDAALLVEALRAMRPEPNGGGGPQLLSLTTPDSRIDPTGADATLSAQMSLPTVVSTLRTFDAIGQHLAGLPGRKTLVWISSGFPLIVKTSVGPNGSSDLTDMSPQVRQASQVLSRYDVAVYPMDTRALQTGFNDIDSVSAGTVGSQSPGQMGARSPVQMGSMLDNNKMVSSSGKNQAMQAAHDSGRLLAQLTGGRTLYEDNDMAGALRSTVDDSKVVYVLGYYPAADKWDSQFHTFKVQVHQSGLKLMYRSGYLATPEPSNAAPEDAGTALEKAVTSPLDSSVIRLLARIQNSGAANQGLTIDLSVNVNDLSLEHEGGRWKGNLDVVIAQLNAGGDLVQNGGRQHSVRLDVKDDYYAGLQSSGLHLLFPFTRDSNAAEMRVVVRNAVSGAVGTLTIPFRAI